MVKIKIPEEFEETSLEMEFDRKFLAILNHSDDFSVEVSDDELIVKRNKNYVFKPDFQLFKTKKGILVGIDRGEFGGSLYFYPNEKDALKDFEEDKLNDFCFNYKKYLVKEDNTNFIFEFLAKLYFTTGLAHMGFDNGELFQLHITDNNEVFYRQIADLYSSPNEFLIIDNKILFVTHESLLLFENNELTTLIEHPIFADTYPNSIAIYDEENIFVGMRGGFLKVDLIVNNFIFYKYKNIEDEVVVDWID